MLIEGIDWRAPPLLRRCGARDRRDGLATAKLNGIEPYAYLKDVLERMTHGHPVNRLDDLLPWNWTPTSVNP